MWIRDALLIALLEPALFAPLQETPRAAETVAEASAVVVHVVDGDTLDVRLDGAEVTLRLLSVDTEEKISGRPSSATKPQTVFGQETTLWAQELFASFPQPVEVGLVFPEGRRDDAFGRLLCHVLLPDGRDYNLLLVELGRSPYFNKYGNSLRAHAAFARAQASARERELGLWNPATNRARTPGAPSSVRPYQRLLPWWEARAAAVDAFRARSSAQDPAHPALVSAEEPESLRAAQSLCRGDPAARVTVFTTIERFFEESDGSLTVLLRSGGPEQALRASLARPDRAALEPRLRASTAEFRQNYWLVAGRVERNERGFVLAGTKPGDWSVAEPEFPRVAPR